MNKLTRFLLIAALAVAYPALSRPSVAAGTPSGLANCGSQPSVATMDQFVTSTRTANSFLSARSLEALTLPDDRWLNGSAGYARAVELQRQLNIPLVVYFYVDWCPYCRTLDSQYFPSAPVQDYLRGVVKVRINPEHGRPERALADRYNIKGYPSFFVMRGNMATPPVQVSPFRRGAGNLTPTQFANACRAIAPVSRSAAASKGSGVSSKFRERRPEVATKTMTTKGGSQIVTVSPASRKSDGRRQ